MSYLWPNNHKHACTCTCTCNLDNLLIVPPFSSSLLLSLPSSSGSSSRGGAKRKVGVVREGGSGRERERERERQRGRKRERRKDRVELNFYHVWTCIMYKLETSTVLYCTINLIFWQCMHYQNFYISTNSKQGVSKPALRCCSKHRLTSHVTDKYNSKQTRHTTHNCYNITHQCMHICTCILFPGSYNYVYMYVLVTVWCSTHSSSTVQDWWWHTCNFVYCTL